MAKTPITNSGTYLPVNEFLKRADYRLVGDLVSDNEQVRVPLGALGTDANLRAALVDASGVFEAAVFKGMRYSLEDFKALPNGSPGQALMYMIIADIAMVRLFDRRPTMANPEIILRAAQWLKSLGNGEEIFPFQETAETGVMLADKETPQDVTNRNGLTNITRFGFGRRVNQHRQFGS